MIVSRYYEEIKTRALQILQSEALRSLSSDTLGELCRPENKWLLRNAVGVALCMARDEAYRREEPCFRNRFTKGNHEKAKREIVRIIKEKK